MNEKFLEPQKSREKVVVTHVNFYRFLLNKDTHPNILRKIGFTKQCLWP
jgi:hypothetical protein